MTVTMEVLSALRLFAIHLWSSDIENILKPPRLGTDVYSYLRGVFLTLILSTVEHLVLILLEFLEFLVEFFQNLLEFLFKIA